MNINGVEFFWGTEFLPEGKKFNPVSMVQASTGNCIRYSSHIDGLYNRLAKMAVYANCNAVVIQDRTDIATGAKMGSSANSCTTLTGHAGLLIDKAE